jgi:hypothetical protein
LSPAVYVLDDRRQQICVENNWVPEHAGEEDEDEHAAEHWEDHLPTQAQGDEPHKPNADGAQGAPDSATSTDVASDPPAPPPRGRAGRRISNAIGVIVALLIVLLVVVAVCVTAWNVTQAVAGWLRLPSIAGPFVVIGSLFIIVPIHRITIGKFERSKRALLEVASSVKLGRCGGCHYSLKNVPPEPDGCTCCPECGGAWRLVAWTHDFPDLNVPDPPDGIYRQRTGWTTVADARRTRVPLLAHKPQSEVRTLVKERSRMMGNAVARSIFRSTTRQRAAKLIAREMVRAGACPCCESPLNTETPTRDGALVCRTCGTAWTKP